MRELDLSQNYPIGICCERYDSRQDTRKHKHRVRELMVIAAAELIHRGEAHDNSKLSGIEKDLLDKYNPIAKACPYGSVRHNEILSSLSDEDRAAQRQHYNNNSHHPEHYENGINGFNLFDLFEMLCDWKAANEIRPGADFSSCLEINRKKYGISDQLMQIIKNTTAVMF